jgi:hypothetical protein
VVDPLVEAAVEEVDVVDTLGEAEINLFFLGFATRTLDPDRRPSVVAVASCVVTLNQNVWWILTISVANSNAANSNLDRLLPLPAQWMAMWLLLEPLPLRLLMEDGRIRILTGGMSTG